MDQGHTEDSNDRQDGQSSHNAMDQDHTEDSDDRQDGQISRNAMDTRVGQTVHDLIIQYRLSEPSGNLLKTSDNSRSEIEKGQASASLRLAAMNLGSSSGI